MTAIDLANLVAQTVWDFFNPDTWRIVLLVLVAWGVLLLIQIRGLLRRLVQEIQFISSFPEREQPTRSEEKSLD